MQSESVAVELQKALDKLAEDMYCMRKKLYNDYY